MSLKRNVVANYVGQGWRVIMSLAFVPLYIKYLGIEAYGLIGIFAMLQAWLGLLDMGMRPTLAREMARFTGGARNVQSIWDLLRSIEVIAVAIAGFIAIGIWAASGWLASDWVNGEKLDVDTSAKAFALMGIVTALQFVESIYSSSLAGLQKQVLQNIVITSMATARGLGAVGVLMWLSPTIGAFFIWQGLISLFSVALFALLVYRNLPFPSRAATFSIPALVGVWRYAGGMIGITLLSLLLTQVDKLILSRLLTLEAFGYYALAAMASNTLHVFVSPISAAYFPVYTELVVKGDAAALRKAYHNGAQLVTVLMGSAAIVLMLFADRILFVWTADPVLAQTVAPLLAVLSLGTLLHGLMWIPYQMQLAHGWTSLAIKINVITVALLVPTIILVVPKYGAIGAAWVWVALNSGYVLIGVHFMYQHILNSEKWIWYRDDVFLPLAVGGLTAQLCRWGFSGQFGRVLELGLMFFISSTVLATTALAAPLVRRQMVRYMPPTIQRFLLTKDDR